MVKRNRPHARWEREPSPARRASHPCWDTGPEGRRLVVCRITVEERDVLTSGDWSFRRERSAILSALGLGQLDPDEIRLVNAVFLPEYHAVDGVFYSPGLRPVPIDEPIPRKARTHG